MKRKTIFLSFVLITLAFISRVTVNAASYNYDFYQNTVYSSEGLAYKDTFYLGDFITNSSYEEEIKTNPLTIKGDRTSFTAALADIYVDDTTKKIYLLDSAFNDTTSSKVKVECTKEGKVVKTEVSITNNSTVYIINEEYKMEFSFDLLRITEEVQEKLAEYYGVSMDPTQFTDKQITSADSIEKSTRRCPFFNASFDGGKTYEPAVVCYGADGICVAGNYIYIADKYNSRILRVNVSEGYIVDEVFLTPNDIIFYQLSDEGKYDEEGKLIDQQVRTTYLPSKIAVDRDGRVYTIASSTYEGIIEYNSNGEFNRFLGKNLVTKRSWWTFLLTDAQYETLSSNNPNQFTNLIIDDRNLIYATAKPDSNATVAQQMIKLINTSGSDVLKRNGYVTPDGDVKYTQFVKPAVTGPSIFVAIDSNDARIYSALDQTRGRIFTYDDEGNLLYISAEKGSLANTLQTPVGLKYFNNNQGEEYVLVLDQGSKSLLVYETTEFGKLVNEATSLYLNNKIDQAKLVWEDVVKMNSNYELGYIGIGKSILRDANSEKDKELQLAKYKEAMEMFELGHDKEYYSDAYKQYRNILIKDNFSIMMTGFVLVLAFTVTLKVFRAKQKKDLLKAQKEASEDNE